MRSRSGPFRTRAAALSALGLLVGTAPAPVAFAQTNAYTPTITALSKNDDRLSPALAFHQTTRLGREEIAALDALDAWVCLAAPNTLPGALGSFTTRRLCADEATKGAGVRYRIGINQTELDGNLTIIAHEMASSGSTEGERGAVRTQAERILLSLYLSNESATALQLRAGVNRLQNPMLATSRSDFAAVAIAAEIASDARMLAQASSLIHEAGMPEALVTRALDVVFPAGEGSELLRIYDQGRNAPGYNPTATMATAMDRLWNANSSDERIRARTRTYLDRAYPSGRPTFLTTPLSSDATRAIRWAAPSSGIPNFEANLLSLAVRVSQAQQLVNYRPVDDVLPAARVAQRRL